MDELHGLKTLLLDGYWPPFAPELSFDAGRAAALCERCGADSVRFGSIGKYAFYPSRVYPPHPDLGGRDLLREMTETGVKVVCYVPVGHGVPRSWVERLHPDWVCRDDAGAMLAPRGQEFHFGGEPLLSICAFGDYWGRILEVLDEVMSHDIAGVYLDGPYQGWGTEDNICQCESCRRLYREETGRPLPRNAETERWDEYQSWKRARLVRLLSEFRARTSARGLPLLMNRTAAHMNGETTERAMLGLVDSFLIEFTRGGVAGASLAHVLGKMIWSYTNAHGWHPRFSGESFEASTRFQGLRALAMGGRPIVSYAGRFFRTERHLGAVAEMFRLADACASLGRLVRYACVFTPADERLRSRPAPRDSQATRLTDALAARGIPVMELSEHYLDEPAVAGSFRVLYVTRRIALTPEREAFLERFAREGGRVVFTGRVPPSFAGLSASEPSGRLARAFANQWWGTRRYDTYLVPCGASADGWLPQTEATLLRPSAPEVETLAESVLYDRAGEMRYASVFRRAVGSGWAVTFDSAIEELLDASCPELSSYVFGVSACGLEPPCEVLESDVPVVVSLRPEAVVIASERLAHCRLRLAGGREESVTVDGLAVVRL